VPAQLSRHPYALDAASFPFPALAAAAARAPIGGQRETVLACFMLARLSASLIAPAHLPPTVRGARAAAARSWLASLALAPALRTSCGKLADATATDAAQTAGALAEVIAVTAPSLDAAAHSELVRLAERLRP
jgi:hypothetical protein